MGNRRLVVVLVLRFTQAVSAITPERFTLARPC